MQASEGKYMWRIYELEVTNNFILNGCIDLWIGKPHV